MLRIFLIATTDLASERALQVERLVSSIAGQATEVRQRTRLILILQNATEERLGRIAVFPEFVDIVAVGTRLSLAGARNVVLRRLLDECVLTAETLVAYPDDDCWYTPDYLLRISDLFTAHTRLGFWFCNFASSPIPSSEISGRPALAHDVVRKAASITLFVRGNVASAVGLFDETLGVGTANSGGEDTDYALRAFLASPSTWIFDAALVGHRDRGAGPRPEYYRGSLIALAKHAPLRLGIAAELVRKVAVGGVLVFRRQLPLGNFLDALRQAAGARSKLRGRRVSLLNGPR